MGKKYEKINKLYDITFVIEVDVLPYVARLSINYTNLN